MYSMLLHTGVSIGFELPRYTVNEGDGSIEVCAVLTNGSLERTVTFTLSSRDDSATSTDPVDFNASDEMLQLDNLKSKACTEIPIIDDSIIEDRENFTLMIRSSEEEVTIDNMRAETSTVMITDNDKVEIGFEKVKYLQTESEEGRTVDVCAVLRNATLERVLTIRLKDGKNIGIKLVPLCVNCILYI